MKKKRLYFVGLGPGDPELLTLKAVRLIDTCDVLFVPVRKKQSTASMALSIVQKAFEMHHFKGLDRKTIRFLYFPMIKGAENMQAAVSEAARALAESLETGQAGVFITLGCSTIYSTAGNLFSAMDGSGMETIFVPGISAINGAAAASGAPLVFTEEKICVIPATYFKSAISDYLTRFETIVLMKVHSLFSDVFDLLKSNGLLAAAIIVEQATSDEERVFRLDRLPEGYKPHYMSTLIIKKIRTAGP